MTQRKPSKSNKKEVKRKREETLSKKTKPREPDP